MLGQQLCFELHLFYLRGVVEHAGLEWDDAGRAWMPEWEWDDAGRAWMPEWEWDDAGRAWMQAGRGCRQGVVRGWKY